MKSQKKLLALTIILLFSANILAQTTVMIGPRVTGNFNIFNLKNQTGNYNVVGFEFGPTVDVTFGKHLGVMVNLIAFDMMNFSNSQIIQNVNVEFAYSLSYLVIDPMFKFEFSGFYMVTGPSLGIKLNSSRNLS